jgi:hypothetical protein
MERSLFQAKVNPQNVARIISEDFDTRRNATFLAAVPIHGA